MPRKNAMRDNVNAVRSRLPHLSHLSREQIELALLYYESNIDQTVDAFNRNGALEALSGWMEMSSHRTVNSANRRNNKPSPVTPVSNGVLRPSQRVSNIFQTFADGGKATPPIDPPTTRITTIDFTLSPSPLEETTIIADENDISTLTTTTTETTSLDPVITTNDDVFIEPQIEQAKPQRRKSVKSRNNSSTQPHEPSIPTTIKSPVSSNKKLLTKSVKDLQRQTSTLANVELSFNNEINSSIKRIDETFKQLHEILKEREIELYLEMDKVKEQGFNVIHRRQQRAMELRQQIDRCDRLNDNEIDHLRSDIKQFVTGRRYELGEELTSSHRFEYDQHLIESLKNFGRVLKIDRRCSIASPSPLNEPTRSARPSTADPLPENVQNSTPNNVKIPEKTSGDNLQSSSTINGYFSYTDEPYKEVQHRRSVSTQYPQRSYPAMNYQNGNQRRNGAKQINGGGMGNHFNYTDTTNTYRRPRPPPKSNAPVKS